MVIMISLAVGLPLQALRTLYVRSAVSGRNVHHSMLLLAVPLQAQATTVENVHHSLLLLTVPVQALRAHFKVRRQP